MKFKEKIHELPLKVRVMVGIIRITLRVYLSHLGKEKDLGRTYPQMKPHAALRAWTVPDHEEYFPDPKTKTKWPS